MLLREDIYQLGLFRNGIPLEQLRKDFSEPFVKRLQEHGVIFINSNEAKVYLTAKGQEVRRMGFEKYLELEKIEREYFTSDAAKLRFRNKIFLFFMLMLILILSYLLINSPEF